MFKNNDICVIMMNHFVILIKTKRGGGLNNFQIFQHLYHLCMTPFTGS